MVPALTIVVRHVPELEAAGPNDSLPSLATSHASLSWCHALTTVQPRAAVSRLLPAPALLIRSNLLRLVRTLSWSPLNTRPHLSCLVTTSLSCPPRGTESSAAPRQLSAGSASAVRRM